MKEERLCEPDVIRAVAAVIVVFFHAYCMMYAPTHFPDTIEIYREKYYWFNSICLWFHMPIFIFVSGGVYGYLYTTKGKYREFWPFVKSKIQRLLVPYVVFAVIFMLTTNAWNWSGLYSGAYSHLWFLSMLFWCFVTICIVNRLNLHGIWFKVIILLLSFYFLCYGRCTWNFFGVTGMYRWVFWFYLGFVVYSNREEVYNWIKRKVVLVFMLPILYGICMWYMITFVGTYGDEYKCFISEIGFTCAVIWIWFMLCWLVEKFGAGWTQCRLIKELSTCSFGIYIFHNWVEPFMISRTVQRLLPLADWAANHTVLFPLIFSLLALLISYVMTKMVLMTRLGRALIG